MHFPDHDALMLIDIVMQSVRLDQGAGSQVHP
jgi:hypothetical protein